MSRPENSPGGYKGHPRSAYKFTGPPAYRSHFRDWENHTMSTANFRASTPPTSKVTVALKSSASTGSPSSSSSGSSGGMLGGLGGMSSTEIAVVAAVLIGGYLYVEGDL